jgi:hypothetical protein
MKLNLRISALILVFTLFIFSCKSKKSSTSSASATEAVDPFMPSEVEVTAIKGRFADANLEILKSGHSIYTGACTNCHGKKNIQTRSEEEWVKIIDRMAPKANLTAEQKDQVWKYVLAMKTKPAAK